MPFPGTEEMRPIAELCSGEQAQTFVRGLTLCHMDATLNGQGEAQRFLAGDLETELSERSVEAIVCKSPDMPTEKKSNEQSGS